MFTIGIRREDKTDQERRAPLAPHHVEQVLQNDSIKCIVESSMTRCFPDEDYARAGAEIVQVLPGCDLIIGVKEIPITRLQPGKPHIFFSHTIKGQSYNMPLLQEFLNLKCTLIDYELVANEEDQRLIFFGVQAGQAGMVNSLWSLGQRWRAFGISAPFEMIHQARTYESLNHARVDIIEAGKQFKEINLSGDSSPIIIGITGYGRVSQGAQEILDLLEPEEISPSELISKSDSGELLDNHIYKVVFYEKDMFEPIDTNTPFDLQEYFDYPGRYKSKFERFLPYLTVLINAIYWTPKCPRIVTFENLDDLFETSEKPRLIVIGDITCDVGGSIECNLEATLPENPVYTVDPKTREAEDGFNGNGILMMAVDILPTEIPKESTQVFGDMLTPYLADIAQTDYSESFETLKLPLPFKKAVIAYQGDLTPDFEYLRKHL
ncbi:MAG: bifunctional lysine ketoglutarate reductase /saccharopine dehydrogenase family protein [Candidatus Electryonea clarkiae]|nr:bifunctional lysine ketoglutarate reductase /saccharopine dehydrogenase family protein [Candidatus Electryonea clarkiae]MDP8286485.1 bifunctional lysine ketoglutarate reductase /saccharopine dehydrogenase family protein [Candidatus Electryonea clarkiae]